MHGFLEVLSTADVDRVSLGEYDALHRDVETPPDFVAQSGRGTRHFGIDDQGSLVRYEYQSTVDGKATSRGVTVEISVDLLQGTRRVGTRRRREVRQQRPVLN
jgi:hypothetical protein